jgi:hypothetical protein
MCVLILLYMCAQLAKERRRRAVLKSPTNYLSVLIHTTICVSSYYYICALILLHVCPHTANICVLILLSVSSYCFMCPHTIICVLILTLLFLLPLRNFIVVHSTRLISLKKFNYYIFKRTSTIILLYVSSYYCASVRILLYLCPRTTTYTYTNVYVSS